MAFKGTDTKSLADLASFRKKNLLRWNATTYRDTTDYTAEAVAHKFPALCEFLSGIYFTSIFPEEELRREKEVICNEITRDWDNDSYRASWALWERLWQENPLRIFGVGTPKGIAAVQRDDLLAAKDLWYVPGNTTIFCTGNVRHDTVLRLLERFIPEKQRGLDPGHRVWSDEYEILPREQEYEIRLPKREKALVRMGCKFPVHIDEWSNRVADLLMHLLVRGSDSRMWREIREQRGLAYSLSGGLGGSDTLGHYFSTTVEALPARVDEVKDLMQKCLFSPLQDREALTEMQEWFCDWYRLGFENDLEKWGGLMDTYLQRGALKKVERFSQRQVNIIPRITLEEIEKLRSEVFQQERFVTIVVKSE